MKNSLSVLTVFVFGLALVGCSPNLKSYRDKTPQFNMASFFDGELCAWGVVRSRNGTVNRKFIASVIAKGTKDKVTLDEKFIFDDGERQNRLWEFVRRDNKWIGTAGDVDGQAVGESKGDTLHLTYNLLVPVDETEYSIAMDDWLHLVDTNTLIGSTDMSKWGFDLGRIDITMRKTPITNCPVD